MLTFDSYLHLALGLIPCGRKVQQTANKSTTFVVEKMAPEVWPEGKGSAIEFPAKSGITEAFLSSGGQDVKPEKSIDFLVDLLSKGDIGKQREAAEELTCRLRKGRDRIRDIEATTLLVDRLASPDARIREHMMTLLFRLAADEEDRYGHQPSRRARSGERTVYSRTTAQIIYSLLKVGPGPKAYETASKLLIKLTNIDKLKDSIASSGGVEALIEMLRYEKGLRFQKDAIATLISLLGNHDENKARAIRVFLPSILLRLIVHTSPEECDMNGILELMGILATSEWGHDDLVQMNAPQALVMLVKSGKLMPQREKVARLVQTLTEDYTQAAPQGTLQSRIPNGGDEGRLVRSPGNDRPPDNGGDTADDKSDVPSKIVDRTPSSTEHPTDEPDANHVRGEKSDANHVRGEKCDPNHVRGEKSDPNHVRGEKSYPNHVRGEKSDPNHVRGEKSDPNHVRGEKSDANHVRGEKSDPNHVRGEKSEPNQNGDGSGSNVQPSIRGPGVPIPPEFFCPLTKNVMKDPVTVSTGEAYERDAIQEWFDSGKLSCPKTKYWLKNTYLKPHYKLRNRIAKWSEMNGVGIVPTVETERETNKQNGKQHETQQQEDQFETEQEHKAGSALSEEPAREASSPDRPTGYTDDPPGVPSRVGDRDGSTTAYQDPEHDEDSDVLELGELDDRPATDEELERVQTLMEVLSSGSSSEEELREAALELSDLAYGCQSLGDEIALVGAEDGLAALLSPAHKASTQEAGIAILLILSLNDDNKKRMAQSRSSVVPAVVGLLRHGSEDGREKAASTLFSLSIPDENKVSIGASDAIPALVDILSGRDPLSRKAQKDAATCLLTLSIYLGNKARAVRAGVVPHLVTLLDDESLLDLVLAMLAVLSSHVEGREAIEQEPTILPKLAQIMHSGTDRNTENALTIFTALVVRNAALLKEAKRLGAWETISVLCRTSSSNQIKNKTLQLLEFVRRNNNASTPP